MRSAPILAAGLVALVAFGVWVTLQGEGEPARPPGAHSDAEPAQPRDAAAPTAEREALPAAPPTVKVPPQPSVAAPEPQRVESDPTVDLRVRTVVGSSPVASFRWRFRDRKGEVRGAGSDGRAQLRLSAGGSGQLLVEADALAPFSTDLTVPGPGQPAAVVDAFLAPAAEATGITLLVHDTALQPVANVRVDAYPLQPGARDDTWNLGTPLWARRTAAADGRYHLPELSPGDYGIRVLATDADGTLLPLMPYRRTFVLTGSSGYVEDVTLEPACIPEFELLDAAGAPIDPQTAGVVQLRLYLPGGAPAARIWTVVQDGKTTTALDSLPGRGIVSLAQPVAAGAYTLEVSIAGQQRVHQFVTLRAGERQCERILVP